ncbi:class I SAM-dependent methyltransferase [Streptomyces sp. NPDC091268]|uniref:class I SAM-dependent methyltransferase n=1 Tax=Streptomyces sp. NPDC091268 TaxID=3365979 RepID=UPI003814E8F5
MTEPGDGMWAAGDAYERYMGRWSRRVAREFTGRLRGGDGLPCADGLRWLDVGCGTGALTGQVVDLRRPRSVLGVDRSAAFVATARDLLPGPGPASFAVADGRALPVREGSLDVVVSGLALNFLPSPAAGVAEAVRVVRPGGVVAAYVWDYAGDAGFLRRFWDAALRVDPAAADLDEARRFPVCRPPALRALWEGAGLARVAVAPIEVPAVFAGFADLWEPFLAGQGPAPGYVAALDPSVRERLREALLADLPVRPDGSIALAVRAWSVQGVKPG